MPGGNIALLYEDKTGYPGLRVKVVEGKYHKGST
jgi:hypothetical protein